MGKILGHEDEVVRLEVQMNKAIFVQSFNKL